MKIDEYLKNRGSNFTSVVCTIDVIEHSILRGTNVEISSTMKNLENLVMSVIDYERTGCMPWEGDGCKFLYDMSDGYDEIILRLDKIISLMAYFNRTNPYGNCLKDQDIRLRITCDCGEFTSTNNSGSLKGGTLDWLSKHERNIGIPDHVVITDNVYRHVSKDIRERLSGIDYTIDNKQIKTYVLDGNRSTVYIQKNTRHFEETRRWIDRSLKSGAYDQLSIYAYTNETLYEFLLQSPLECKKVRVLTRSWIEEEKDEFEYNNAISTAKHEYTEPVHKSRLWKKSHIIKSMAEIATDPHVLRNQSPINIEWKFYDHSPILKGALLRNSETGKRAVHFGQYRWSSERPDGGSPYVGDPWVGIWLWDDQGPQTEMINAFESRFEEAWAKAKDKNILEQEQKEIDVRHKQDISVKTIWSINENSEFLILVPGRKFDHRPFPFVSNEDLMCMRHIENFLLSAYAKVSINLFMDEDDFGNILGEYDGHLVLICKHTLNSYIISYLNKRGFPFTFGDNQSTEKLVHKISHCEYGDFWSPMDKKSEKTDYCVIAKCDRENSNNKLFIIAGIHGMGTWGGGIYMTDHKHLNNICNEIGDSNFTTMIECEFEVPQRIIATRSVLAARRFL